MKVHIVGITKRLCGDIVIYMICIYLNANYI